MATCGVKSIVVEFIGVSAGSCKHFVLLSILIFVSACGVKKTKTVDVHQDAWWLAQTFEAAESRVLNIEVTHINQDWQKATLLSPSYLQKQLLPEQYSEVSSSSLSLDIAADINNDGKKETVSVGVYKSKEGKEGRFLLISQGSQVLQSFYEQGLAGFSALYYDGDEIRWYKCLECGDFDAIVWSNSVYMMK